MEPSDGTMDKDGGEAHALRPRRHHFVEVVGAEDPLQLGQLALVVGFA